MANARIALDSISLGTLALDDETLIWSGDFQHKKEREEVYYTHELKGDLIIKGAAFQAIRALTNNCEAIAVTVEKECAGVWTEHWTGSFTKFDCKFDYDKCVLTVSPKADSPWICVKKEWADDVNFFSVTGGKVVNMLGVGDYEFSFCVAFDSNPANYDIAVPCAAAVGGPPGLDSHWCVASGSQVQPFGASFMHNTTYHRILAVGASPGNPPALGTGWALHDAGGNIWWRCPIGDEQELPILDRGRLFNDVLVYLVGQLGCGLTLRSHFFGINDTHTAPPSNIAYDFAVANCQHVLLLQKSDVKRPFDTNAATSSAYQMKLRDLFDDLRKMFKVYPKIVGNDLILEHISYFTSAAGLDLSDEGMKLQLDYGQGNIARETRLIWMDEQCEPFFKGVPILYDCGDDARDERVNYFSTDIAYISKDFHAESTADAGFCLIAAIPNGSDYAAIEVNRPFAWTSLIENLHRFNADFPVGTFGSETDAITVRKNQKQPAFSTCLTCSDDFDPGDFITTPLGEGEVQEASYNIFRDSLSVQLNYE
jgi:hypothetical protein